jgi:hypothetical protein
MLTTNLQFSKNLKLHPEKNSIGQGEAVGYITIFTLLVAIIFIIISLINVAFKSERYKFYLWLCVAIVVPLIVIKNL